MRSERAKELIEKYTVGNSRDAAPSLLKKTAILCVELAEQEVEEQIRGTAIAAFCVASCPKGCSFGTGGGIGCGAKYRFIQKLNET